MAFQHFPQYRKQEANHHTICANFSIIHFQNFTIDFQIGNFLLFKPGPANGELKNAVTIL
jgi:hypothetical protein